MNDIKSLKKNFIRLYDNQEIEAMNYIFDKNVANNWFTQEELVFANQVDLFNKENLYQAKNSWIDKYNI